MHGISCPIVCYTGCIICVWVKSTSVKIFYKVPNFMLATPERPLLTN